MGGLKKRVDIIEDDEDYCDQVVVFKYCYRASLWLNGTLILVTYCIKTLHSSRAKNEQKNLHEPWQTRVWGTIEKVTVLLNNVLIPMNVQSQHLSISSN